MSQLNELFNEFNKTQELNLELLQTIVQMQKTAVPVPIIEHIDTVVEHPLLQMYLRNYIVEKLNQTALEILKTELEFSMSDMMLYPYTFNRW